MQKFEDQKLININNQILKFRIEQIRIGNI